MNLIILSLRFMARDWRAGELYVLAMAVIIAVAAVSSVGLFTDRVRQALERQANELLAADLVLSADSPLPPAHAQAAAKRGLRTARAVELYSMVFTDASNRLAEVKAVSEGYPLRGELRVASAPFAPDIPTHSPPRRGEAWADSRLLHEMNLRVGDKIWLGELELRITRVVTFEPDRSGALFNIAPRLMINEGDLAATQLIQPGSRVRYRLLVAGPDREVRRFRASLADSQERGQRLETAEDARPELRAALDRARQFLGLASLVSVVLAGAAIATGARRFAARRLDHCALMRCFGAQQRDITTIYMLQIVWLALAGGALGIAIGYGGQWGLVQLLGELAGAGDLPPPSIGAAWAAMLAGLATLLGFALPPLLHLRRVPTLRVLRGDLGALPAQSWTAYALGLGTLGALMIWQAGELMLGLLALAGTAATLGALALCAWLGIMWLARLRGWGGVWWRFGLSNLRRHRRASVIQVVAFGLGAMALLVLGVVRADLLRQWQGSLPPDAPNRFVINIQPDQVKQVEAFFAERGMNPRLHPMVRGRLTAINSQPANPDNYADDHARRLASREFNLSWAAELPDDNRILAGRWWSEGDQGKPLISVEEGIAQTLGIKRGDTLTYNIAGEVIHLEVASLRAVSWDSFRVNFFVLAPPGVLDNHPATYITAFFIPSGDESLMNEFVKQFPKATVIDVASVMDQVRSIMSRVARALQYVFLFTLAAGLLVLCSAIEGTLDERIRENAVLRALGAERRRLVLGMAVEFGSLGAFAGLIAATAAAIIGYVLARHVFEFDYALNPWLWATGALGGAAAVTLVGWLSTRRVLLRPPWETLRASAVR